VENIIPEDDIEINIKEMGCETANWIRLYQESVLRRVLLSAVMPLRVTEEAGNLLIGGVTSNFHGIS
jgi:hypothetical protein